MNMYCNLNEQVINVKVNDNWYKIRNNVVFRKLFVEKKYFSNFLHFVRLKTLRDVISKTGQITA